MNVSDKPQALVVQLVDADGNHIFILRHRCCRYVEIVNTAPSGNHGTCNPSARACYLMSE